MKGSISATPFSLTYGMEAIIPTEFKVLTLQRELSKGMDHEKMLRWEVLLGNESCDITTICLEACHQRLKQYFKNKAKEKRFQVNY